ncbi:hypothetical protein [Streptomyces sp. 3N207]|uniref:hypothetical protein n=1 Tax=Streptomyces sp. 3N207 TaxID=3457417 RepID=UPI003FD554D1
MFGKYSKDRPYYACQPKRDHHADASWYATHPKAIWISERIRLDAVHTFFEQRLFGPDRAQLLAAQLAQPAPEPATPTADIPALRAEEERLARGKCRLLEQLAGQAEDDDGDPEFAAEFRKGIRKQFDRLERQRRDILARITEAETATQPPKAANTALLDTLPQLRTRLRDLPPAIQREIFDAFQLQIRYDHRDRSAEIQVTIAAALTDRLNGIAESAAAATEPGGNQPFSARPRQDSNLRPSA